MDISKLKLNYYIADFDDICDAEILVLLKFPKEQKEQAKINRWSLLEHALGLDFQMRWLNPDLEYSSIADKIELTPGPRARDADISNPLIKLYSGEYALCFNSKLFEDELELLINRINSYTDTIGIQRLEICMIEPGSPKLKVDIVEDTGFDM